MTNSVMTKLEDTYKHKGQRKQLAELLRSKGISDERIISVIAKVPRHFFFENALEQFAYQDKAFPIGNGQTISQPYTVAYQTQLLDVKKGEKILEIGTGSGYQTCVLYELGADVYSIERQRELYIKTKQLLLRLKINVKLFYGDGYEGLKTFAPFNKILVTAGAAKIPQNLLNQLSVGGRLVIPVGDDGGQIMTTIDRVSENDFQNKEHDTFKFVPMLEDKVK